MTETLTTRCPHCSGPLALQRAAPGCDQQLVITCVKCGATSRSSGEPIETLSLARPVAVAAV